MPKFPPAPPLPLPPLKPSEARLAAQAEKKYQAFVATNKSKDLSAKKAKSTVRAAKSVKSWTTKPKKGRFWSELRFYVECPYCKSIELILDNPFELRETVICRHCIKLFILPELEEDD
jgi:hypothetical protein